LSSPQNEVDAETGKKQTKCHTQSKDGEEAENPLGGIQVVVEAANPIVRGEFIVEVEITISQGAD